MPAPRAAFAVADHQVAHVYVQRRPTLAEVQRPAGGGSTASSRCWTRRASARPASTIRAPASWWRSRRPDRWFSYYYWLDDERAPDFARTVDIHRKPGYDPVELFVDPAIRLPMLADRLAARASASSACARCST